MAGAWAVNVFGFKSNSAPGIPLLELDHPFHAVNYFGHGRLPWV
jgi:hypothetical protein